MNVTNALERVYEAFSKEAKPRAIATCPCCVDKVAACRLLSTPLRQISADVLSGYAASVLLTVGDRQDFRYFLPRILDISLRDRHWWPDREVVLGKLRLAEWSNWSDAEREALLRFFDAAFEKAASLEGDAGYEVDSWICALTIAGVDVRPLLQKLALPSNQKTLIEFYEKNSARLTRGRLSNAFWADHKNNELLIVDWFKSPQIQSIFDKYYGAV